MRFTLDLLRFAVCERNQRHLHQTHTTVGPSLIMLLNFLMMVSCGLSSSKIKRFDMSIGIKRSNVKRHLLVVFSHNKGIPKKEMTRKFKFIKDVLEITLIFRIKTKVSFIGLNTDFGLRLQVITNEKIYLYN